MSNATERLDRIKSIAESAYGVFAIGKDDILWLIEQAEFVAGLAGQKPTFWYVPAAGEDDEDALLLPTRDGKCPSSYTTLRAYPLFAGPQAAYCCRSCGMPDTKTLLRGQAAELQAGVVPVAAIAGDDDYSAIIPNG